MHTHKDPHTHAVGGSTPKELPTRIYMHTHTHTTHTNTHTRTHTHTCSGWFDA